MLLLDEPLDDSTDGLSAIKLLLPSGLDLLQDPPQLARVIQGDTHDERHLPARRTIRVHGHYCFLEGVKST